MHTPPPPELRPSHYDPQSPEFWQCIAAIMALAGLSLLLVGRVLHWRPALWAAVTLMVPLFVGPILCPLLALGVWVLRGRPR